MTGGRESKETTRERGSRRACVLSPRYVSFFSFLYILLTIYLHVDDMPRPPTPSAPSIPRRAWRARDASKHVSRPDSHDIDNNDESTTSISTAFRIMELWWVLVWHVNENQRTDLSFFFLARSLMTRCCSLPTKRWRTATYDKRRATGQGGIGEDLKTKGPCMFFLYAFLILTKYFYSI